MKIKDCSIERVGDDCTLFIGSVSILIEKDMAEKIVTENLPEDKLVWHVNREKGSTFFNDLYPEWSVVPHPEGWVAGNIYYRSKQAAMDELQHLLNYEIEQTKKEAATRISILNAIRDNMSLATKDKQQ